MEVDKTQLDIDKMWLRFKLRGGTTKPQLYLEIITKKV